MIAASEARETESGETAIILLLARALGRLAHSLQFFLDLTLSPIEVRIQGRDAVSIEFFKSARGTSRLVVFSVHRFSSRYLLSLVECEVRYALV